MSIQNETHGLDQAEFDALEALVDRRGIESILMCLSELCGMKAEHIEANWQDHHLARRWATVEGALGCAVPKAVGL